MHKQINGVLLQSLLLIYTVAHWSAAQRYECADNNETNTSIWPIVARRHFSTSHESDAWLRPAQSFDCVRFDRVANTHATVAGRVCACGTPLASYTRAHTPGRVPSERVCVHVNRSRFDYETPCSCFTSTRIQFNDRGRHETTRVHVHVQIVVAHISDYCRHFDRVKEEESNKERSTDLLNNNNSDDDDDDGNETRNEINSSSKYLFIASFI